MTLKRSKWAGPRFLAAEEFIWAFVEGGFGISGAVIAWWFIVAMVSFALARMTQNTWLGF